MDASVKMAFVIKFLFPLGKRTNVTQRKKWHMIRK